MSVCDPMDGSTPDFPVLHHLPEFTQTHIHWVGKKKWLLPLFCGDSVHTNISWIRNPIWPWSGGKELPGLQTEGRDPSCSPPQRASCCVPSGHCLEQGRLKAEPLGWNTRRHGSGGVSWREKERKGGESNQQCKHIPCVATVCQCSYILSFKTSGMGREEGGGFRMGNTCIPVADSFWYLAKLIQLCKV